MPNHGRTFPIFENPFFAPQPVVCEGGIDRLRSTPGLEDVLFRHADDDAVLFDMLLKIRVPELGNQGPDDRHQGE